MYVLYGANRRAARADVPTLRKPDLASMLFGFYAIRNMTLARIRGFTLFEMLVTVSVIGILVATAAPSLAALLENRRAAGAAESVMAFLHLARSESIKQMRPMVVSYATAGTINWRIGMRDGASCDPTLNDPVAEDACSIAEGTERVMRVISADGFRDVAISASRDFTRFEPVRATAAGSNVTLRITTRSGREVRVIVANSGRIRSCSPTDDRHLPGYPAC